MSKKLARARQKSIRVAGKKWIKQAENFESRVGRWVCLGLNSLVGLDKHLIEFRLDCTELHRPARSDSDSRLDSTRVVGSSGCDFDIYKICH